MSGLRCRVSAFGPSFYYTQHQLLGPSKYTTSWLGVEWLVLFGHVLLFLGTAQQFPVLSAIGTVQ